MINVAHPSISVHREIRDGNQAISETKVRLLLWFIVTGREWPTCILAFESMNRIWETGSAMVGVTWLRKRPKESKDETVKGMMYTVAAFVW